MEQSTKIILALYQIENISNLIQDNQWEQFLNYHLSSIKSELNRQLTLLQASDSIKE